MRQAIILAGGQGTRLRSVLGDLPKSLADVGGTPLLGHQLRLLARHGFDDVVLLVGHGADQIRAWLAGPQRPSIPVRLLHDGTPRGTAGAVLAALPDLAAEFAVLYGDTMPEVDLARFWACHEVDPAAAGSLLLHANDHPRDCDRVEQDSAGNIVRFHPHPHPKRAWLPNLVNAALYILRRDALAAWRDAAPPLDFAKDLFPRMVSAGARLRGYQSPEYIMDIGTPARLDRVRRAFADGAIGRAGLEQPRPGVLIDRDGTLNRDVSHLRRAEGLEVFPGVGAALRRLNQAEWRTAVITNQPVLARGQADEAALRRIHARLDTELAVDGAYFDRYYYCPHHPDAGVPGEVAALKIVCDCRKPAPGLVLRAARDLNLDPAASWVIGDSTADLGAAEAAGVSAILVRTGNGGLDGRHRFEPGFTQPDFAAAVGFILDDYRRIVDAGAALLAAMHPNQDWFVGGPARSGKSTVAAMLARELRQRGQPAVVVQLDAWARTDAQPGPGAWGGYAIDLLVEALGRANGRRAAPVELAPPAYAGRFGRSEWSRPGPTLPPGATVIWDGVVALELARRCGRADRTIQVDAAEAPRLVRVRHEAARRGASAAWREAEAGEHETLVRLGMAAAHKISLDGLLGAAPSGRTPLEHRPDAVAHGPGRRR
ncbi:HAD-IIIA family hydrolase [Rhodopila sp.]|uniref:HAD-IIIA family hydrolase n=1 Tax=Rhodopila sp. TaxID=2480087 RepID=UPI003D143EA9